MPPRRRCTSARDRAAELLGREGEVHVERGGRRSGEGLADFTGSALRVIQLLEAERAERLHADNEIARQSAELKAQAAERKLAEDKIAWLASFPEQDRNPVVEVEVPSGLVRYLNPAARELLLELHQQGLDDGQGQRQADAEARSLAGRAFDAVDALSDRERYELQTLRNEIAELAKQRDKAARLIKEAIRR